VQVIEKEHPGHRAGVFENRKVLAYQAVSGFQRNTGLRAAAVSSSRRRGGKYGAFLKNSASPSALFLAPAPGRPPRPGPV